jgi:hypothetical protein
MIFFEGTPVRKFLWLVLLSVLCAPAQSGKKRSPAAQTLTGCLDQRDGQYILADEKTLEKRLRLEPAGFDRENFARYVGHKVALTGQKESEEVFRVREIKTVAETCTPDAGGRGGQ